MQGSLLINDTFTVSPSLKHFIAEPVKKGEQKKENVWLFLKKEIII
jgi:hypothetical protein